MNYCFKEYNAVLCTKSRGHEGDHGSQYERIPDQYTFDGRSKHSFSVTLKEEDCRCGDPASHKVGEEQPEVFFHNLTNYMCCRHFSEYIGSCGGI